MRVSSRRRRGIVVRSTLSASIISVSCLTGCQLGSCWTHPRNVEFGQLRSADRIDVNGTASRGRIATIADPDRIRAAAEFIQQYEDGWIDVWTGPRAPMLILEFYQGDRSLGHFGFAQTYLVAGSLSRDAPPDEIRALVRRLGLEWPTQPQ